MSALCHKQTFRHSFDHLVGAAEQRDWECDAKRLRGLEVDYELELGREQDRSDFERRFVECG
jgi:hypothetical protein